MSIIKRQPPKVPVRQPQPPQDEGGLYFTSPKTDVEFIPSGCALLDCVLGGGWPLGRISNIVGDKSTGKTLLAIEACANFARRFPGAHKDILYIEAEAAFDEEYAKALGLPERRVEFIRDIDTVEDLFECMGAFLGVKIETKEKEEEEEEEQSSKKKKKPDEIRKRPGLIIVDSLDALSDKAEMKASMEKGSYGAKKARLMSQLLRRLVRPLEASRTHTQIVSQVRDAIGQTFGDKLTRSGGRALDFYVSQALWLRLLKTQNITREKITRAVALTIGAKCKKNKIALPLRECEFTLRFGYGIEDLDAGVAFLEAIGKGKLVPLPLADLKRLRGNELNAGREALNKVVVEQWYIFERNFVPPASKYPE